MRSEPSNSLRSYQPRATGRAKAIRPIVTIIPTKDIESARRGSIVAGIPSDRSFFMILLESTMPKTPNAMHKMGIVDEARVATETPRTIHLFGVGTMVI